MDVSRFRSFAERYVIERASTFKVETEIEDAWSAVERAKTIYKHIDKVAEVEQAQEYALNAGNATNPRPQGATGCVGPLTPSRAPGIARRVIAAAQAGAVKHSPAINSQSWTGRKP